MSEQRGHGPTEQREWGEGWPRTVCADEGHRTELDVLRNRCEDCGGSFTELVPLSEAEAALARERERAEKAEARASRYEEALKRIAESRTGCLADHWGIAEAALPHPEEGEER